MLGVVHGPDRGLETVIRASLSDMTDSTQWYWDLGKGRAVPEDERGPSDDVLGPYPSRAAAENWRATVEARNEAWDDADEKWDDPGGERES